MNYSLGRKDIIKTERCGCSDVDYMKRKNMITKMNKEKIRLENDVDKLFKEKEWIGGEDCA